MQLVLRTNVTERARGAQNLQNGTSTAISTLGGPISFRELRDRVYKIASALQGLGIGRGDIAAVHLPNIPEFVISWVAINLRAKGPERLEIVPDMPMTPTRKIIKRKLVRRLLAHSDVRGRPAA